MATGPLPWWRKLRLRTELVEHSYGATGYAIALAWTHLFLPVFGAEAAIFEHTAAQLMKIHADLQQLCYVWLYTAIVTTLCWFLCSFAEQRAAAFTTLEYLADHVWVTIWTSLAFSLVYVTVWAWICALLFSLPTDNPVLAFGSSVFVTVVAATSVVAGQRGWGPCLFLEGGKRPERLKTIVFFTTIMTAMMWVGTIDYSVHYFGVPSWASCWLVAAALLAVRWAMVWSSGKSANPILVAAQTYPTMSPVASSLSLEELGLSVAMRAPTQQRNRLGILVSSLREMQSGTLGLAALVVAWAGAVALQAASTATWSAWPWFARGKSAVVPNTFYAIAMSSMCVFAVAAARAIAESEGKITERADALDSETASLAVASGWAWFNALASIIPALDDKSLLPRAIGSVAVTGFGVMVMLALKPPEGTAYSASPSRSTCSDGALQAKGSSSFTLSVPATEPTNTGFEPIKASVHASPVIGRLSRGPSVTWTPADAPIAPEVEYHAFTDGAVDDHGTR